MDSRLALMLFGLAATLLLIPAVGPACRICKHLHLPKALIFVLVLLLLGILAELTFFVSLLNTSFALVIVWSCLLVGGLITIHELSDPLSRKMLSDADCWLPFAVVFANAACVIALFAFAQPAGISSTAFAENWLLHLPNDNVLPQLLAQHVAAHAPPKPFVGDWLSSDRPPLQSGFDLMFGAFLPDATGDTKYQSLAMVLQSFCVGAFLTLCRMSGCSKLRSLMVTLLTAMTGFVFLNTVFVWPKLLAAAFVIAAISIYIAPGKRTLQRCITSGLGFGLAMMSHGGVAFTLPALLVVALVQDRRQLLYTVVPAACATIVILSPWVWYQKAYDPPGDRLLKWHLAGQIDVTDTGFVPTLRHAYLETPISTIMNNKVENIETLFGVTLGPMPTRNREFFYVGDAMGVLGYAFLASLAFFGSKRYVLRFAATFGWIAVFSLAFWCFALYLPKATVVHVGSDATELLMFLSAGLLVSEWAALFVVAFVAQLIHFCVIWIPITDAQVMSVVSSAWVTFGLPIVGGLGYAAIALARGGRLSLKRASRQWGGGDVRDLEPPPRRRAGLVAGSFAIAFIGAAILLRSQAEVNAQAAARNELSVSRAAASAEVPKPGLTYAIDSVIRTDGTSVLVGDGTKSILVYGTHATVIGWALDPGTLSRAPSLRFSIDARAPKAVTTYGYSRPDVAKALGNVNGALSGFSATLSLAGLSPGMHVVSFFVFTSNKQLVKLPTAVHLFIRKVN